MTAEDCSISSLAFHSFKFTILIQYILKMVKPQKGKKIVYLLIQMDNLWEYSLICNKPPRLLGHHCNNNKSSFTQFSIINGFKDDYLHNKCSILLYTPFCFDCC